MDPDVRRLPVVLTEPVLPPTDISEIDRETTVEKALANRPDLKAILQNIVTDDLSIDQAANALRPDLSLTGRYVSAGRGGTGYVRENAFGQSRITSIIPGGFGDALNQIFDFGFPTYMFGFTLRLPIRDRAAQANMSDAVLNKRLDVLRARSLEQNIRQDTLTAISQVESSKAGVRLAIVARDLAQKQLDAQQKRYDLGTTVIFFVLDAQTRLIQQESQLVNTSIQYRRNVLSLFQRTGELLEERGILIQ
jgi:outer membrane protein TolC